MKKIYGLALFGLCSAGLVIGLLWLSGAFEGEPALPVLPMYPDSKQVSYERHDTTSGPDNLHFFQVNSQYVTDAEVSGVTSFYTDTLSRAGWHYSDSCGLNEYILWKGGRLIYIARLKISRPPGSNQTIIDINLQSSTSFTVCDLAQ